MNKQSKGENSLTDALTIEEKGLKNALSSHLDEQVENLDFNVTSRLSAARHRALAGERRVGFMPQLGWPAAVSGACAAVFVAVLCMQLVSQPVDVASPPIASPNVATSGQTGFVEDLHILSASDDIEFYQSVEFLQWMEMNSG